MQEEAEWELQVGVEVEEGAHAMSVSVHLALSSGCCG